ncbi:hypothetical protein [Methanobrevibacter sp.]|uniref:hypothetical protein n=1 Tax=Methanobrevibacter sp. TaxID=66852 RepID=UPI0025F0E6E2|nr:hypothetical protein [Methanobrevibacter sp.]MBQ2832464.1 hypothetical protein [Methanobrevibacter sp.]
MRLRNVVLTRDCCKRAVLPQSRIQPALPIDIVLIVFLSWLLPYLMSKVPYLKTVSEV